MSALFVLIGFSILIASGFLAAFIWSVSSGQYEDDYTPSVRILFDEDKNKKSTTDNISNKKPKSNAN